MKKEVFEKAFKEGLNKNFNKYSKYFDFEFYVYPELGSLVFEINKCLIIEFSRAAITLTNHLLERVLKLSLIYNETGIRPILTDNWVSVFTEPNKKFSSINLGSSIEKCKKEGLITDDEKVVLFDTIRNLMRNGFSHADPNIVLDKIPDESTFFQGSFTNPTELKKVKLNQKIIPVFQSIQMENFAKENAFPYFDFIFRFTSVAL
ncbi:MAG: hypothetical protein RBT74_17680 [Tenuifilaceae bacterium]|jgi:hypothetical protein|nr:hypothetical protein [Tenuifilaceae bacterium]